MAQSLHLGSEGPSTYLPFGICAICFDVKVSGSWLNQPHLKNIFDPKVSGWWLNQYARQNGFIFPNYRGANKTYLSCHHPKTLIYDL